MRFRPSGKHGFNCSEFGFRASAIGGSWGAPRNTDSLAPLHRARDLGGNVVATATSPHASA